MELDRYWLGVTGSFKAVASRLDQSDFGSPPVQAASSSFPTRHMFPMMGFMGFHDAGGVGLVFPVPEVPGVGGVVDPLMMEMSSRLLDWDQSATEPLSEISARREKGDPSWGSTGF